MTWRGWAPWTLAGLLLALLIGTVHGYIGLLVDNSRVLNRLYPKGWQ